jgi:hypothetical protein
MVQHIGERLADAGFSQQNILISASHTHSGPGGYANFETLNTTAPSLETATDPLTVIRLFDAPPADPQLYRFLTDQIVTAIRRADADRGPAVAGWGSSRLLGVTENRSLEAHLGNHGLEIPYGEGRVEQDPGGYEHTINPDVNVLRVDKLVRAAAVRRPSRPRQTPRRPGAPKRSRGRRRVPAYTGQATGRVRRVPIGAWSTFANHGTVTWSTFEFYNADHHASAMRVFEDEVRREGNVPASQEVLNVYGNSDEGDMSASLDASRARGVRPRGTRRGGGDARGVEGRGHEDDRRARARRALDADLLLRAAHRGRAGRRHARGRPSVPERLRGGARPARRRHARALRGQAPPGSRRSAGTQDLPARRQRRSPGRAPARRPGRTAAHRLRAG